MKNLHQPPRLVFYLAMLAYCLVQNSSLADEPSSNTKWNLVAIVTDDQGRWATGAHDNKDIHTPRLDKLAQDGAIFTQALVVAPVCSPSRATYLTGLYPTELKITDWIAPSEASQGMGLKANTWPQALQKAGYKTALIGKWHLGTQPEFHPTKLGFDHFMGFLSGGNRPMNPTLEVEGKEKKMKGALPDLLVDDAIAFVKKNKAQPFALCLHFRAPHRPYGPVPEQDKKPYEGKTPTIPDFKGLDKNQVEKLTRDYYASITSIDRNVGRLLDTLDELDLSKKTVVIFTSDHGYNEGRHGVDTKGNGHWMLAGRRGPKRPNMWDSSVMVPFFIRWPGVVKPGTKINTPFSNLDIYRTVLGILDVNVPENCKAHGVDFSKVIRGTSSVDRRYLFGQYDLHNSGLAYLRMVRTPKYKYVRHFRENFMDEFYDLEKDPNEQRNLIRRRNRPEAIKEMDDALLKFMKSINDPLLADLKPLTETDNGPRPGTSAR